MKRILTISMFLAVFFAFTPVSQAVTCPQTASNDTLGTFRTNVNTCFTGLASLPTFSWPFTIVTHWGQTMAATSTALRLTGSPISLSASSTAVFSFASSTNASTTLGTINNLWLKNLTGPNELAIDAGGLVYSAATTTFTAPLLYSAGNVTCRTADGSNSGCLTSADWTTFNGKQATGNYITALTSDVTASGPGSVAATIAANAVTYAKFQQVAAHSLVGNNTNATANAGAIGTSTLYGSSTPWAYLAVNPTAGQASNQFVIGSSSATNLLVTNAGATAFGTSSPWGFHAINPTAQGTLTGPAFVVGSSTATLLVITNAGSVGVASSTPWRTFDVNGSVGFKGLTAGTGAGALCLSATNEVLFSSGANCVAGGSISGAGTQGQVAYFSGASSLVSVATSSIGSASVISVTNGSTAYVLGAAPTITTAPGTFGGAGLYSFPANLSVATATPWGFFSVNPTAGVASNSFVVGSSTHTTFLVANNRNVGVGTTSPWALFSVNPDSDLGTIPPFSVGSSTGTDLLIDNKGNTLLGTSTSWLAAVKGGGLGASSTIASFEYLPATSTSQTVDWAAGNSQLLRIGTAATTITFSNNKPGEKITLIVCNPAGGTAGAITWPTTILWAGGSTPSQTTTATKCDVWSFIDTNGTTTEKQFGAQTASF